MLLTKRSIPFRDITITDDPALAAEMHERSGSHLVPQVFIGEQLVGGFDELCALDKSGELEKMLGG